MLASFGRRRGRKLRSTKQGLVDTLLPRLLVDISGEEMLDTATLFPHHPHEVWLEIGFGSGEHLAGQAQANPDAGIIGCEPYVNGFGNLLMQIEGRAQDNIRLFTDDARLLMAKLPDASLSRAFILFPDPWPKSRHHKRRLIQQPFLDEMTRVLKPGAELRLATDHVDYLTWMLEHLLTSPHFEWQAKCAADWTTPPPDWVRTKYQEWAETEGRIATYLRFTRK